MTKVCHRDGWVRAITMDDLQPGTVIREVSKEPGFEDGAIVPPYADATILSVRLDADGKDGDVVVARPYLYVSNAGTTAPSALTGVSTVNVRCSRLIREDSIYMLVCGSRGQSFKFVT